MTAEPTMFTGGRIRLMKDADLDSEMPEALLVQDGVVRSVGSRSSVLDAAGGRAAEVDLDGRTLMPGFVDAHAHTLLHGSGLDWVDLSDVKTIDDLVQRLSRRAAVS